MIPSQRFQLLYCMIFEGKYTPLSTMYIYSSIYNKYLWVYKGQNVNKINIDEVKTLKFICCKVIDW